MQIALSSLRPGHQPDAPAGVVDVRKTGRDAGLDALAASIDALGLIQPLVVVPGGDGFHDVVDGSRRHAALESLVAAGRLAPNSEVPVTARDVETAREAGLAANINQVAMHEADQVEAYAELRRAGQTEKDIAARFGQPVAQVRKLLALGGVSPAVLDAWRAGKVSVEDVRTFTLASVSRRPGSRAGRCPRGRPHLVDPGEARPRRLRRASALLRRRQGP